MALAKKSIAEGITVPVSKEAIGWREWASLPEFGIEQLKVKVDTGARTSALHAFSVEPFEKADGTAWVRFGLHPDHRSTDREVFCEAQVLDQRLVRDSGGNQENRYVIGTEIKIGPYFLPIELTLTARDDMLFRMLLGRTALKGRFIVDPSRSYVLGKKKAASKK